MWCNPDYRIGDGGKDKKDAEWIRLSAMTMIEEIILRQARLGYPECLGIKPKLVKEQHLPLQIIFYTYSN